MWSLPDARRVAAFAAVALLCGALALPFLGTRSRPAAAVARPSAAGRPSVAPTVARSPLARPVRAVRPPPRVPPPRLRPGGGVYNTTGSPLVALTFDDGPDPQWTPRVLRLLRQHRVRATFCLIGVNVAAYPRLVAQIARDGHTLCNHTVRHDMHLAGKSPAAIGADMAATTNLITRASGGVRPRYFRAPGGRWSSRIVAVARAQGMAALGWSVDPQDWARPPAAATVGVVRRGCRPGSIVLLHDAGGDRTQTFAAVRTLIPELARRYRLVAL